MQVRSMMTFICSTPRDRLQTHRRPYWMGFLAVASEAVDLERGFAPR
jgi:hypothetical protein